MRTETKATTEAIRSIIEWSASLRIATDPVTAAAASFRAINAEFEAIETAAARDFVMPPLLTDRAELIAATSTPRCEASFRAARPR